MSLISENFRIIFMISVSCAFYQKSKLSVVLKIFQTKQNKIDIFC